MKKKTLQRISDIGNALTLVAEEAMYLGGDADSVAKARGEVENSIDQLKAILDNWED